MPGSSRKDHHAAWRWAEAGRQDAAYALRQLGRQPGFAAIAVVTLALGIGANAAIFGVIDVLLLRPPRFEHVDRLVSLQESNPGKVPFDVDPSPGKFLDWRERTRAFDVLAAWRNWYFTFGDAEGGPAAIQSVRGVRVSPSFFAMLGVSPVLGREFQVDEEQPGRPQTVLLSHAFWRRRFGGDTTVVGRSVRVDGSPFTIGGVLPADFQFFQPDLDIWMPLTIDDGMRDRTNHSVMVFGRIAAGVSRAQAEDEINAVAAGLGQRYQDSDRGWQVRLQPLYPTAAVLQLRPALLLLLGAASLVLLIACANVANLLLGRAIARKNEMAIRASMGASRGRLVRQLFTESLVLASVSAAAGTVAAYYASWLLVPLLPRAGTNASVSTFRAVAPVLDGRMLGFSLAVAVITAVVFGLIPARQTARSASTVPQPMNARRSHAGRVLMAAELALSIVLLAGAGLLIESFWKLQHLEPGFRPDHLLTMQLWLPAGKHATASDVRRFFEEVVRRVEATPGVVGAAAVSYRPFLSMGTGTAFEIRGGSPGRPGAQPVTGYRVVTPRFVQVIGQALVAGRDFTDHDGPEADGVAIVNETLARRYWPGVNVIGEQIRPGFRRSSVPWELDAEPRWLTVVGVVRDIRGFSVNQRDEAQLYVSALQFPSRFMFLTVRTVPAPLTLASPVQAAIRAVDPDQPVSDVRAMDDAMAASVPRFNVELLGVFAALALVLAAIGVYGVCAYAVSQRTREIGVRIALGAGARDVLALIVGDALRAGLAGLAVGLPAAWMFARAMSGLLYGVAPGDVTIFAIAASTLFLVVVVAAYLPARRASGVDPAQVLRAETT